ncbi:hypothetical protein RO3G_00637 [Rhizopus delemar RA 99-880]|uniref:Tc1-like transposase DDE domain-containing protein n=1 Tax=Rhizopus delemar (strain RA 99-880 / ATCC MYA-4621 / FGSC 9543 / NRRL 43880) TaxID=246409 RepID=I1BIA3_RHIO9|nr:hypothetical protein RO3G_00637 [Rhizopus delemar RA 99-880]|eukprot:EIE75933.1 hypothetical protein RO3G_00637 [Rhizopus delemar RA 99-880]
MCAQHKDGFQKTIKIYRSIFKGRLVVKDQSADLILTDEHEDYTIQWADKHTNSVVLEDMLDALTERFRYLQITRSGFYKFVRKFSWSKEGNRTVVKKPRTRAKITIILGVITPFDVVNISYLVMDNVPVHTHEDIQKHIESRGYGCVYLPPYSPEFNLIEQFWSVCKSKLKREQLLDEETLPIRITYACNRVLYSDLQGFCRYSASKFDDCLNRKPI